MRNWGMAVLGLLSLPISAYAGAPPSASSQSAAVPDAECQARVNDAERLYKEMKFEAATAAVKQGFASCRASSAALAHLHVLDGIIAVEDFSEARARDAFAAALSKDRAVKLPDFAPPRVVQIFEAVKAKHAIQPGDGTPGDRLSPVPVGSGYASIATGSTHMLGLKSNGTLWAWGNNLYGQLGDGTNKNRPSPLQIGSRYAAVDAGFYHTVALKTDGTLWTWGRNNFGQLGDGTKTDRLTPVRIGSGFASVAAGWYHTVALKTDGTLWAWGRNGDGTKTDRLTPVQVGSGFVSVVAAWNRTVGLKTDGTFWVWGSNSPE